MRRLLLNGVLMLTAVFASAEDAFDQATERARELCAKMTLEEKAGELMVYDYASFGTNRWNVYKDKVRENGVGALMRVLSPGLLRKMQDYKLAHSRLKIPLIIHEDITHGWSTTLPLQIAMACSWDDEAVEKAESVAAREAAAIGIQMTYSPQCDVSCDPRWGRIGGTLGEDPYLSSRMTAARVRGDQGRTFEELTDGRHVISCVKHFVGYGSLQGGKDYRHLDFSRRELFETHLPPFQAAVDAGALAIMNAYTVFEGVPCNFNRYLLTDLLRGKMGFRGQLVTDWTTLTFSVDEGAAQDSEDAAVRGLAAGVDMDMASDAFLCLPKLMREGKVREADLDVAVVRSLALKYLLGLFDNPYRFCDEKNAVHELFSVRNQRDVLELTRETLVLLKNDGQILPLDSMKPVALAGTWADDTTQLRGGMAKDLFAGPSEACDEKAMDNGKVVTIKEAMAERWGECLTFVALDPIKHARGEMQMPAAETVVLTLGEPSNYTGERCGRATLTLPETEMEQLRMLKRAGKRIVSVVFAGRPFLMEELVWLSDAVLLVWYPGAMGGIAVAETLCGENNPSGKLAQHIPLHPGQIPLSYREKRTFIPCTYEDMPATPLYPFGYGLSYTSFVYSKPVASKSSFKIGEPVKVAVNVRNTGRYRGREVVQLYVRDEVASVLPRERELKNFASVWLDPGEEKTVSFELTDDAFALYDKDLKRIVETGAFTIYLGGDSTTQNAVSVELRPAGEK